jgi:hypothetical protein
MKKGRIYVAALLLLAALILSSFIVLYHYPFGVLLSNLRNFLLAEAYSPVLLLLLLALVLTPSPLLMLYLQITPGRKGPAHDQLVLHVSDGRKIQAENQQIIAHLQSLLQQQEGVKSTPVNSTAELPRQPLKVSYPSLDAEALEL